MADRPLADMTLHEIFSSTEHTLRDLAEHLDQSLIPRVQELERLVGDQSREERARIPDATVRSHAALVLGSDEYTRQLLARFEDCLTVIERRANALVG